MDSSQSRKCQRVYEKVGQQNGSGKTKFATEKLFLNTYRIWYLIKDNKMATSKIAFYKLNYNTINYEKT